MNILIYGASSDSIPQQVLDTAYTLGAVLARRGITAVCGGGYRGVMGRVIDGQLDNGAAPIGVLPRFMVERGWAHPGLTNPLITDTMHQRKQQMLSLADGGAVAMPGGIGTFEELTEAITWRQLNLYSHPVVIMNIDGYYDMLLEQLQVARRRGFMRDRCTDLWHVATNVDQCLDILLNA